MRFAGTASALDGLADALRRSDASWAGGVPVQWDELTESEQHEWRVVAREVAAAVSAEVAAHPTVVRLDGEEDDHPRPGARPR